VNLLHNCLYGNLLLLRIYASVCYATFTTSWAPPQLLLIARGEGKMHSCFSVYPTFWSCTSVDTCSEEVSDLCSDLHLPTRVRPDIQSTYYSVPSYVLIGLPSYPYFKLVRFLQFLHLTKSTSDPIPSSFFVTSSWSLREIVEDPVEKRYHSTSIEYPSIYLSLNFWIDCSPLWTYLKGWRVLCTFKCFATFPLPFI
jgi:hypothetical protein